MLVFSEVLGLSWWSGVAVWQLCGMLTMALFLVFSWCETWHECLAKAGPPRVKLPRPRPCAVCGSVRGYLWEKLTLVSLSLSLSFFFFCNTQEGLLTVVKTGWLWSPGRQSTPNSKLGKLFIDKKPYYQHITYGLQSDWLHVCKAILLVQTSWATCLQSNSIGTNGTGFCSNLGARRLFSSLAGFLLGAYWLAGSRSPDGAGNPTISLKPKPKSRPPASPSPGSPT